MTTLFRVLTVLALLISVFAFFQANKAMKYPRPSLDSYISYPNQQ